MRLIGLTGRSGSGKSTVGVLAQEMGIPVLDCDAIYREITSRPSDCLCAIRDTFGEETVRDGALCRSALREKVFSDREAMKKLNSITAEYITREIDMRLQGIHVSLVLLDAPTLFECGVHTICDVLMCVVSDEQKCIERIMKRDGIDETAAKKRLQQQHTNAFFCEHCDIVLHNDASEEVFRLQATDILRALQKGER